MSDNPSSDMPSVENKRGTLTAKIRTKAAMGLLLTFAAWAGRMTYNSYTGMQTELQSVKDQAVITNGKIDILAQEVKDLHSLFLPRGLAKVDQ